MSESQAAFQDREEMTDELLTLLSPGQLAMLISMLRAVREQNYGEVCLQVNGNRLFIVKSESFDGGILHKLLG